jgi:hypothetical protein
MGDLKKLALRDIASSIGRLRLSQLFEEALSVFASRQDLVKTRLVQLLMYFAGTRNFRVSTSSSSNWLYPLLYAETLFRNNYLVIFLGRFPIAETFSHHCYKPSWMEPLSVVLVAKRGTTATPS